MNLLRRGLLNGFDRAEALLDRVFTPVHNPLKQLGALGTLFFAVVIVTGVHLYIGYDTSVSGAYGSVEYLSVSAWFLAGVARSLHRYASDALVLVMLLHAAREFARDRYRGARWFSWVTGIVAMLLVYGSGIGGYWLVWDELAQFIAIVSMEWLDWLPIFGEPIAGIFVAPDALDDRFFTLLIFLHIALPLMLALVLWLHLQRISRAAYRPPWRAALGAMAMLVGLSVVFPAVSHPPADLARLPAKLGLDWFYLAAYPLMDRLPRAATWGGGVALLILFTALPWLPPLRRRVVAVVDLDYCNGCGRCNDDCPYNAIAMVARTDGKPFETQAVVNPGLCVGCGICVGACPPSTPFRTTVDLPTGIDLPDPSLKDLRGQTLAAAARHQAGGPRVLVFACAHGPAAATEFPASVTLPCVAMLPPSFIDFALSRHLADGVMLAGCDSSACYNRLGERWTDERLAGKRDPRLRARVDRARVAVSWVGRQSGDEFRAALSAFAARLSARAAEGDKR
ncbi:MAG: cytochrome b N-terminal domain-containing protein [Acetobacteraceae bacterium]|nr:cytochrome b N-terminal domain-containing protein [Acetobacteraceae bacterium]